MQSHAVQKYRYSKDKIFILRQAQHDRADVTLSQSKSDDYKYQNRLLRLLFNRLAMTKKEEHEIQYTRRIRITPFAENR